MVDRPSTCWIYSMSPTSSINSR